MTTLAESTEKIIDISRKYHKEGLTEEAILVLLRDIAYSAAATVDMLHILTNQNEQLLKQHDVENSS